MFKANLESVEMLVSQRRTESSGVSGLGTWHNKEQSDFQLADTPVCMGHQKGLSLAQQQQGVNKYNPDESNPI